MTTTPVPTAVGFADGEIISYTRKDTWLVVHVRAWNAETLAVVFQDVIAVLDLGAWSVSDLRALNEETAFLRQGLSRQYEKVPHLHPYREYRFLDAENNDALCIVAAGVTVDRISAKAGDTDG